jgi:hypothetical protein
MIAARAAALIFGLAVATPVWADDAHHPAAGGSAPPAAPATMRAAAGDGMPMTMMSMMGAPHHAMMGATLDHIEGRIAFLDAELKITDAQRPLWRAFADVMRSEAREAGAHGGAMPNAAAEPALQRLNHEAHRLTARLDAVHRLRAAVEPLYAALDADQKRAFDALTGHPLGLL